MTEKNDLWGLAFGRLAADPTASGSHRPNPQPAGMLRRGSTTHLIWEHMVESPGRLFQAGELQAITCASRGAVSFALFYLARQGLLEAVEDPRHPRYQRYRLKRGANAVVSSTEVQPSTGNLAELNSTLNKEVARGHKEVAN